MPRRDGADRPLDPTHPPRRGEELDVARLDGYLRQRLPLPDAPLTVEQFPSGYSNLTYLLRCGAAEWVLRRPPFGSRVRSAHDMGREHRVLSCLHRVYPPAPEPTLFCDDEEVLGAPFYVMQRIRGVILRRRPPEGIELTPALARRLSEAVVDQLATLHTLDYRAAGLADLGRPEGYVERQITGWTERYRRAATHRWEGIETVAAWLADHLPREAGTALLHNDYKYDNLVLDPADPARIRGVLDWEMCTVGDPRMDLGSTLAYWVEAGDDPRWRAAGFGPTAAPGSLTRREIVARYTAATGTEIEDPVFFFVYGLFKLAVIVQQIFYRYAQGHTHDRRFADLDQMVGLLGDVGSQAIERGRL